MIDIYNEYDGSMAASKALRDYLESVRLFCIQLQREYE